MCNKGISREQRVAWGIDRLPEVATMGVEAFDVDDNNAEDRGAQSLSRDVEAMPEHPTVQMARASEGTESLDALYGEAWDEKVSRLLILNGKV